MGLLSVRRPAKVVVQGLGLAGAATAVAVADATGSDGMHHFEVTGLELPSVAGQERAASLRRGRFPHDCADPEIAAATGRAVRAGRLRATTDPCVLAEADVVVVSVNLDLDRVALDGSPAYGPLLAAVNTAGALIRPAALIVIECTVPAGTCRDIIEPALRSCFSARALDAPPLMAFSYERVMPGAEYLASMKRLPRVYGADCPVAADAAAAFLSMCAGPDGPAPRCIGPTVAAEFAKLLENSYRAVNIALLDEWSAFGEALGVNVFDIVEAIRERPTHSNLREPGLGIGGYCLTKDPILAVSGLPEQLRAAGLPLTTRAVEVGQAMPLRAVSELIKLRGELSGDRILLLGVTYRPGVADTRSSASEVFYRELVRLGAEVSCHDPLVRTWRETGASLPPELPSPAGLDVIVFAVAHDEYLALDLGHWLGDARPLIFDANHVLTTAQIEQARKAAVMVRAIGRGDLG